ncbi:magnesium transporter [Pusillimonas sp. ANT_WB101]|uniref:magnesium transporter n=1 Tax=Pusillimonas sp. ANT_WB101 TaxID=2597356 RepID=UPI0011EC964C|nr:magnesium transporter [Pusillimonas sp. ANT_WB101]KAA0893092.1 magnesium transporter [Pusillimonas sp. ANT_WB101]
MFSDTLILRVQELLYKKDSAGAAATVNDLQSVDAAAILQEISHNDALSLLLAMKVRRRASVFGYLPPQTQAQLAQSMSRTELATLFEHMEHDERADLYNNLTPDERLALLPGLAHAEREDVRLLASYPEGTVGSVMTSAYVTLQADQTVNEALNTIRHEAPDKETIYLAYIIDEHRHVLGTVSLRELILASPAERINTIMTRDPVFCLADSEQSEAARLIAHYDLLAVPVMDATGQIVGIVTHDDALDVTQAEDTEDQLRLGAVGKLTGSLRHATVTALYKMRVGWLVVLVFGNLFSGAGIAHFEDLIASMVSLVFFLPLLIDSGGNAGSQSATMMVRALATGDVRAKDWIKMLGKEVTVSVLLGLTMAAAVSFIGVFRAGTDVAIVVALTMVVIVAVGSVIGMSLPFILTRFKFDPASASAPLITSICDGAGVLIYFNIASLLLPLPGAA